LEPTVEKWNAQTCFDANISQLREEWGEEPSTILENFQAKYDFLDCLKVTANDFYAFQHRYCYMCTKLC